MRIAVSGTHRSGKSTLVDELSEHLPGYTTVDEPYLALEEEGYEFADPPSIEDFLAQLERSIESVHDSEANVLFDRCPVDFLGYLSAHDDADAFDVHEWLPRVRKALRKLDLLVLVPIESPDRIGLSASEDEPYRAAIDEKLKEILLDDSHELGVDVVEVEGNPRARALLVLARLRRRDR